MTTSLHRLDSSRESMIQELLTWNGEADVLFHCADGVIESHQVLFAMHSELLRSLFQRFQRLEWSGDVVSGQLFPLDRRKGDEAIHVLLPDFRTYALKHIIALIRGEEINISSLKTEVADIKGILSALDFSSLKVSSLTNILDPNRDFNCGSSVIIKSEVFDELYNNQQHEQKSSISMYDRIKKKNSEKKTAAINGETPGMSKSSEAPKESENLGGKEGKRKKILTKTKSPRKKLKETKKVHVEEDPENISWQDIPCISCTEPIKVVNRKRSENRRRYQTHLLRHFQETLFSAIPTSKTYDCQYEDCGYSNENRTFYIQHIAFKHNEWYKRINIKLQDLSCCDLDENMKEDQTDLNNIKHFFINDERIKPPVGHTSQQKPLWVEGLVLGDSSGDEEYFGEETEEKDDNSIEDEIHPRTSEYSTSRDERATSREENSRDKLTSRDDRTSVVESLTTEDIMASSCIASSVVSDAIRNPELNCGLCSTKIRLTEDKVADNRRRFISHIVESHTMDILFPDVLSDQTTCGMQHCSFKGNKLEISLHREDHHDEFIQRLEKHLKMLQEEVNKQPGALELRAEQQSYNEIRDTLMNDPRLCRTTILEKFKDGGTIKERFKDGATIQIGGSSVRLHSGSLQLGDSSSEAEAPNFSIQDGVMEVEVEDDILEKLKKESGLREEAAGSSSDSFVTSHCPSDILPRITVQMGSTQPPDVQEHSARATFEDVDASSEVEVTSHLNPAEPSKSLKEEPRVIAKEGNSGGVEVDQVSPSQSSGGVEVDQVSPSQSSVVSQESAGSKGSTLVTDKREAGWVCKSCTSFYRSQPEILAHVLEQHMTHLFKNLPKEDVYKCAEHKSSFNTWVGYITHNLFKHVEAFRVEKEYLSGMIEWVESSSQDMSSAVAPGAQVLHKEIKQEMILNPLPIDISDSDLSTINWICKHCPATFQSEDEIRQHVVLEHLQDYFRELVPLEKIYTCTQCHNHSSTNRQSHILHLAMSHQVVEEERIYACIRESRALLLDIDVIRCRCGKSFESKDKIQDHIISVHYKARFTSIPKRQGVYSCGKCSQKLSRRYHLIQHLVQAHAYISQQEIEKYIAGGGNRSDLSQSEEDGGDDDSSIDFNDSVSQAHLQREVEQLTAGPGQVKRLNLRCPVCTKKILQSSNFEDHLQTHGIRQEPLFQCLECDTTMSFALQFYHLAEAHSTVKPSVQCLCCQIRVDGKDDKDCISKLKVHALTPTHAEAAAPFMQDLESNLYFTFRYSCQLCSTYFKTVEAIARHGTRSKNHSRQDGVRLDPVYTCHLCDFSKAASKFSDHCMGIQHGHKVQQEAEQHSHKYGLHKANIFYSCETCNIAADFNNILHHFNSNRCSELKCGPCDVQWVEDIDPKQLIQTLNQHVLTDKHTNCVAEFVNIPNLLNQFNTDYRYKCESCGFVFTSLVSINKHSGCKKLQRQQQFRCLPCETVTFAKDFLSHISSQDHKTTLQNFKPLDSGSTIVDLEDDAIDVLDSPPQINIDVSPPFQSSEPPAKKRKRMCPTVEMTDRAPSPAESILELPQDTVSPKPSKTLPPKGAMAPRPSSPAESVMEISHVSKSSYGEKPSSDSSNTARPVSPAESILELPQSEESSHAKFRTPSKQNKAQIKPKCSATSPRSLTNRQIAPRQTDNQSARREGRVDFGGSPGSSRAMSTVSAPSVIDDSVVEIQIQDIPDDSLENVPVEDVEDIITLSDPQDAFVKPRTSASRPSTLTSPSTSFRSPAAPPARQSSQQLMRSRHFVCRGTCGQFFTSQTEFKHHVKMHESKKELADIECIICQWREKSPGLLGKLSTHIVGISHYRNKNKFLQNNS